MNTDTIEAAIAATITAQTTVPAYGATWYALGRALKELREALQHAENNDGF